MNEETKAMVIDLVLESTAIRPSNGHELDRGTAFYELGIDSIGMLSILLRMEKTLSVSLTALGDQLEAPVTLGDLLDLVDELRKHIES